MNPNFFIAESHSQMFKTCAKNFLGRSEEKVHGTDFDIICPSGLRTYKNGTHINAKLIVITDTLPC